MAAPNMLQAPVSASLPTSQRWWVLAVMTMVNIVNTVVLLGPAPLIGDMAATFGLSLGQTTALAMGVINFFIAVSALLGGWLLDRVGAAVIWVAGMLAAGISLCLVGPFGADPHVFALLRFAQGCAAGPIMAAPMVIVAQWFAPHQRSTIVGTQAATVPVGAALAFLVVPWLNQHTGSWQQALTVVGMAPIAVGLLATSVLARVKSRQREAIGERPVSAHEPADFRAVLRMPATWVAAVCVFCLSWLLQAFNDLTPAYLSLAEPVGAGLGQARAGAMMALTQISFLVGSLSAGVLAQRLFRGRARPTVLLGFAVAMLMAVSLRSPSITHDALLLPACLLLMGFAMSLVNPQVFGFLANHYPPHVAGKVSGLVMGFGIFGGTSGVLVGSWVLHSAGAYEGCLLVIAAAAALGCLVATRLGPPGPEPRPPPPEALRAGAKL